MKNLVSILALITLTCNSLKSQDSDCIFDLETQTNEFLKETEFWKSHNWDENSKTAFINISEYETLEITRGGCVHFGYYIKLTHYEDSTELDNYDYWFDQISTWSRKLNDFDNEIFKSSFSSLGKPDNITEDQIVWFLKQENYCSAEIWIEKGGTKTTITIGYYQC